MVNSIKDIEDMLDSESQLNQALDFIGEPEDKPTIDDIKAIEAVKEIKAEYVVIPEALDDALFFLYINGLSFDEMVKRYEKSPTPFNKRQLYKFSHKHNWALRKEEILKELKVDFNDMIRYSQAKKMTAISMAVQSVSDMIIRDVADLKADPQVFWREVNEMKRPRPFWLARNVDELMGLYKLQKALEEGLLGSSNEGDLADDDRKALLSALSNAATVQINSVTISKENKEPQKVIEAEIVPEVKDGSK